LLLAFFESKDLNLLNSQETCELDMRETEILFFLLVVIMIRSRKTGSVTMISYLSSGFTYAKGANLILFFLADPRLGLVYLICFLLQVFLYLLSFQQCWGSVTFWCGSGSADQYVLLTDPYPTPDPVLFFSDFKSR
jgi:hypothetical protein